MRMKNYLNIKGWALNLVLMQRPRRTQKWPIEDKFATGNWIELAFACVCVQRLLTDRSWGRAAQLLGPVIVPQLFAKVKSFRLLMKNLGGKEGELWKMCKWRMCQHTHHMFTNSPKLFFLLLKPYVGESVKQHHISWKSYSIRQRRKE